MSILKKKKAWQRMATDKKYREEYAIAMLKRMIPYQVRAIRKKRGWSQGQLAEAANVTQGVISRVEDPNYGNLTLTTIGRIAAGYDLAAIVKLVPFSELLRYSEKASESDAANVLTFEQENSAAHASQEPRAVEEAGRVLLGSNRVATGAINSSVTLQKVSKGKVRFGMRRERESTKRRPSLAAQNDNERSYDNAGRAGTNDGFQFGHIPQSPFGNPEQLGVQAR
jgi:transcriptional regulator with XRE-family HTH domain